MEIIWSSYAVPYIFIIYEILFFHSVTIPKVEKQINKTHYLYCQGSKIIMISTCSSQKKELSFWPSAGFLGERNWNTEARNSESSEG